MQVVRAIACLTVVVAGASGGSAFAQDSEAAARAAEACRWSHGGGQLAVVSCVAGLDDAVLAAAGRAACSGHALCAAWIYDDPSSMPVTVPTRFEDLSQANVTGAIGVWVEEDSMLIRIEALR